MRELFKNISFCKSGLPNSPGSVSSYFAIARKILSVFFRFKNFTIYWLIFSVFPSQAFAAAGGVISNTATIDFLYLGLPLTQESSPTGNTFVGIGNGAPTTFTEDQVVNFSVVSNDVAPVDVVTGDTNVFLTFTVANSGNATQDFLLTSIDTTPNPFGAPADNFDLVPSLSVFVEDGTTAGYQLAEDTALFVDELAPGSNATVYVVANIPAAAVGDLAAVVLVVQIAVGGAPGEGAAITNDDNSRVSPAGIYSNGGTPVAVGIPNNTPDSAGVDLVFGDPAGAAPEDIDSTGAVQDIQSNGQHSDTGAFLVQPSGVAVDPLVKTVTVIDTLGGTDPHPGATLRYQIVVTTTGASVVDNLVITDVVPPNTTFVDESVTLNGVPQTNASDADNSEFDGTQIIVSLGQITTATTNTIVFDVTID